MTPPYGDRLTWVPVSDTMTKFASDIGRGCRVILSWSGTVWQVIVRDDEIDVEAQVAEASDLTAAKAAAERHMRD